MQVRVTEIIANTYYARVHVSRAGDPPHEVDVDARPSDAINLAVRFGAPVYISKKIAGAWITVCLCAWAVAPAGLYLCRTLVGAQRGHLWRHAVWLLSHARSTAVQLARDSSVVMCFGFLRCALLPFENIPAFCCARCVMSADSAQPVSVEQLAAASGNESHADIVRR
jgi:hypothetical protein